MTFFKNNKIIASLTSYPLRIETVHLTVQSLLNQTIKADKLILWLSPEEFPGMENDLPSELLYLSKNGLEIEWCNNIRSYKKLIPALKKYRDEIIITFDDDLIYNNKTLEILYDYHKKYKKDIIVHRITRMFYNESNELEPFKREYYYDNRKIKDNYLDVLKKPSYFNKLTGCGGCLYPPGCFHNDVFNEEIFMQNAPTSDDIWFWLQAVRKKRKVRIPKKHFPELQYIPGTQDVGLYKINDKGEKLFFVHLKNIMKLYPEIDELLKSENKKNTKVINSIKNNYT